MTNTAVKTKEKAKGTQKGDPMLPRPFRVMGVRKELADTFTMELKPENGGAFFFKPGQFNMLYVFGVGEIPISISGDASKTSVLVHTTRSVGKVSSAINALKAGDTVGVRGPFGTDWPVAKEEGMDLLFVAGGVGLAPLRPAIYHAMNNRKKYGVVTVLCGARTPEDMLFMNEVKGWRARLDMEVRLTVDRATDCWKGCTGVVPKLITKGSFDPAKTAAFVCGPEIMMHFTAKALLENGLPPEKLYLSMERNMKCGVGLCGHCQWGADFVCKDGPVYSYDKIASALSIKEL